MSLRKQPTFREALAAFHNDEDGLETLQVVLIVAIAAIIFVVIKLYWSKTKTWSDKKVDDAVKD